MDSLVDADKPILFFSLVDDDQEESAVQHLLRAGLHAPGDDEQDHRVQRLGTTSNRYGKRKKKVCWSEFRSEEASKQRHQDAQQDLSPKSFPEALLS